MKKKRNLYIIAFLCFISLVGVTIAYLQSTDLFENVFNAGTYSVVTHEEFTSPTNWAPGDTTPKTITTTNEGTIPVRVRVKLEEYWISSDDDDLPLESNDLQISIINFANLDDWVKDGDYYYYVGELAPGETTSSLIESVTFNPEYQGDISCTSVDNTNTCESSSDGYMGGIYTLNITTETVQSDAYQEVWNLNYNPTEERVFYDISDGNEYATYEETNKNIFIRKTMLGETMKLQEVGFLLNGNVYYLKGAGATFNQEGDFYNNDSIYYEENKTTLFNAFESENCTDNTTWADCRGSGLFAEANDHGNVDVRDDYWLCGVYYDSSSACHNN